VADVVQVSNGESTPSAEELRIIQVEMERLFTVSGVRGTGDESRQQGDE